jgi:hypothetical protein
MEDRNIAFVPLRRAPIKNNNERYHFGADARRQKNLPRERSEKRSNMSRARKVYDASRNQGNVFTNSLKIHCGFLEISCVGIIRSLGTTV